jgi:ABC-type multidrug transport system ATPase subunit
MDITIKNKKLHNEEQTITVNDSVLTLIGENGCGKSTILESIFSKYLTDDALRTICFSSGQNELFTQLFNSHKSQNRRYLKREDNNYITSFYFNHSWARILIFISTILKPNGHVREFLKAKNYIQVSEDNKEDITTRLTYHFRIRKYYSDRIRKDIELEATPDFDFTTPLLRKSHYHETLQNIVSCYNIDYEFETHETLFKRKLTLNNSSFFNIFTDKDVNRIFTFWSLATYSYHKNIELDDCRLYFRDNIELEHLSDGEYQLLSIYAMIDLFDNENTIFLFDEIDSHLYYKNLDKLWKFLQNSIQGKVITTTHISDSILKNDFTNIKLIQNGKVEHDLTLKELAKRLSNVVGKQKYEYQLASRVKNIVLIDNEDDWVIFKKLAEKKITEDTSNVFSNLVPFQRTSSYNNNSEIFGKGKLKFAQDFKDQINGHAIQTKNIFMICDRDKLSKNSIDADLKVNVHADFHDIRNFNGVSSHLLSWKRMEIENYLVSVSMLTEKGKIQDLQNQFARVNFNINDNLDDSSDIEEFDAKILLHPLYKPNGFEESALDELISLIPIEEISDDIVTMYNYLKSNIAY